MSWEEEIRKIEERRRQAREMGGPDAVERQHERGRWTVRERIAALVDEGSFLEDGPIAGFAEEVDGETRFTPGNYVVGRARIDGRPVAVGGEDFTQRGGSPTSAGLRKSIWAEDLALRYRVPLVRLLEGGGGSVAGGSKTTGRRHADPVWAPPRFGSIAKLLDTAPVASAALGAVAGFPAARLAASHFAVMTRTAQVLIAGPAVVERALGVRTTKEELGGPGVHLASGVVDAVADDEAHALALIRRFLSYLPTRAGEPPPAAPAPAAAADPEPLADLVPRNRRKPYDVRRLLGIVFDPESVFELRSGYGTSIVAALARLGGAAVGVVANDPRCGAGAMTADAARKFRSFVELCDRFRLPVVSFVDEPGFMIGPEAESAGTIREGTEAINRAVRSSVPWATIVVRRAYGVAAAAHFGPGGWVLAWPSADVGAIPVEGGVAVAFRREIEAAPDPEAKRAELEEQFAGARSPFPRAEDFGFHDLIDPRETRARLLHWIGWVP